MCPWVDRGRIRLSVFTAGGTWEVRNHKQWGEVLAENPGVTRIEVII
jgi:hypothetical protein